jgi:transcriptional regulator of acetoin/glycerol metabolism
VQPVGATDARPIDVRFIAASSRDLTADVETRRFLPDLFLRLDDVTVVIPPVRERSGAGPGERDRASASAATVPAALPVATTRR